MTVRAEVDAERRAGAMRHHTGTHLLHAALREILGPHVKQAGSLVAPDRLRFDFSHYAGVSPRELRHIENRVNGEILKDTRAREPRSWGARRRSPTARSPSSATSTASACASSRSPASPRSSAAAPTCPRTGEIGLFLFTAEQGISAGTRRVEALDRRGRRRAAPRQDQGILEELEEAAKVDRRALVDEYAKLREQLKAREREIQALKMKLATGGGAGAGRRHVRRSAGVQVWTPRFEGLDRKAHAAVVDEFRNRNRDRPFVAASRRRSTDDGVNVISAVSESLKDQRQGPRDPEAPGPARRRPARLRPGRRRRARRRRRAARGRPASVAASEMLEGEPVRPSVLAVRGAAAGARPCARRRAEAQIYTRVNGNGVIEATNVPDDPRLPAHLSRQGHPDPLPRLPRRPTTASTTTTSSTPAAAHGVSRRTWSRP